MEKGLVLVPTPTDGSAGTHQAVVGARAAWHQWEKGT